MRVYTRQDNVDFELDTSGMERKFHIAQVHLDNRVLMDSSTFIPEERGELLGSGIYHTVPGRGEVIWNTPYAHYQYAGRAMVGVESGRAWARRGEPKRENGKSLKYRKKKARARWFKVAKSRYLRSWLKKFREDIHG